MQTIEFGAFRVRCDPDETREVYARFDVSGAEDCGCEPCYNFALARHLVYPTDVLDLFDWLGVDPLLESEVVYNGCLERGLHSYSGFFHVVGELEACPVPPLSGPERRGAALVGEPSRIALGFFDVQASVPEAFDCRSIVELEFCACVPWISVAPEPIA